MGFKRVLVGVGSLLCPAVFLAGGAVMVVLAFSVDPDGEIPVEWRAWVVGGILLLFAAVAGVWFFIIYDIVHAARNPRLSGGGCNAAHCRAGAKPTRPHFRAGAKPTRRTSVRGLRWGR
jgi:hypothetical protein